MKSENTYSVKYIGVLEGIRALSVILVLVFHFWQQTWISPSFSIPAPFLNAGHIIVNFTPFARVGFLFVDMMVLISGFLLFLPVARNVFSGEKLCSWKEYFRKRALRILPGYLLCIAVLLIIETVTGGYGKPIDKAFLFTDLISHLTFTHMLKMRTYFSTKLNGVLWTLAVEVWFYILFPIFASFIKRRENETSPVFPLIRMIAVAAALLSTSWVYIFGYALAPGSAFAMKADIVLEKLGTDINSANTAMTINQLPAFFGVYSVGMFGAFAYVGLASVLKKRRFWVGAAGTALSVVFIVIIVKMVSDCAKLDLESVRIWQIRNRLLLALVFTGFILSTAFSLGFYRFLFSNKVMGILAAISYELYIWHQWLSVKIKYDLRIPPWVGEVPPNQLGTAEGAAWSAQYAVIIVAAAFGVAALLTHLYEKPVSKLLSGEKGKLKG